MNIDLKNSILSFLKENDENFRIVSTENIEETVFVSADNTGKEIEIGIASDGTRYDKMALNSYIFENRLSDEQYVIDHLAKKFEVTNANVTTAKKTHEKYINVNILEKINSDDEIQDFLDYAILKELKNLRNDIKSANSPIKEYKVISIGDGFSGGVNAYALENTINEQAKNGWILKFAFANELGKNAAFVGGLGLNSTQDQNILSFERTMPSY